MTKVATIMATSEYIRRNDPSEKQADRIRFGVPTDQHFLSGYAFASKLMAALGDAFIIGFAFMLAVLLKVRFFAAPGENLSFGLLKTHPYFLLFAGFLLSLLLVCRRYGLYRIPQLSSGLHELRLIIQATFTAGLLLCGGLYMARWGDAPRTVVILMSGTTAISLCAWRLSLRLARYRKYEKGLDTRNIVVLGTNHLSCALGQHIMNNYRLGYRFLGYVAPPFDEYKAEIAAEKAMLGSMEQLRQLTRLHFIDEVVVAQTLPTEHVILLLEEARDLGIDIRAISGLYNELAANASIEYLGGYPVAPLHRTRSRVFATFFKRLFDIIFSVIALAAVLPLMLIIALAVSLDSEGTILYASERIGKRGRVFTCFKFRTMVKDAEKRQKELAALNERDGVLFKVSDDPRITRIGRFLRKFSLDELPQLFNVLRGEMSIVGPRPPIATEVAQYELEHFRRLEAMPGITGLWQVQARQDSSFAKYIELDTAYVENWSFWLDVKILMRTVLVVVNGTGT